MTTDGVLVGAILTAFGIVGGVIMAEFFHERQARRDDDWSRIVQQQQTQIDALQEYIEDRSGIEASAEDLWGQG